MLAGAALLFCLAVVVLGAYVRLSSAGPGCLDWPGCYGHISPAGAAGDTHVLLATAHSAGAALLLMATVNLNRALRPRA
jgi:cytochrome c oxidase assembly protein subunit 15